MCFQSAPIVILYILQKCFNCVWEHRVVCPKCQLSHVEHVVTIRDTYGQNCRRYCEECHGSNGTCTRCKSGYYVHVNGCSRCSFKCKYCENYLRCYECEEENYLNAYDVYVVCRNCSNNACNKSCDMKHCKICRILSNSNVCIECDEGYKFNGDKCVSIKDVCSEGCSSECDSVGFCLGNCFDGWTGDKCADSCPEQCLQCSKNNSNICQRCIKGRYKSDCKDICPYHCKEEAGASSCRINDGYCLSECENNFWGDYCNYSCSAGCASGRNNATLCSKIDGHCMNDCKEGFTGEKCETGVVIGHSNADFIQGTEEKATPSTDTTLMTTNTKKAYSISFVVIGLIVGGVAASLIIVSVLIACFIKRSKHRTENANRCEGENVMAEANLKSQPAIPGNDDCLYAQVNKINKSNNIGKEEQETASRITYDVEVEEKIEEALNVDDSDLEEIEEDSMHFMESEVNIPTSDTYYNTASLLRSRTEVSYLPEYIKNKTDYKKEFERLPVGLTRACTEAFRPNNRVKNRYKGIYAYDATRVVLKSGTYVNANFIDGHKQYPAYIASLGPTKSTMSNFETFWEMIWQEKTYKIVMLTNLDESKKMKCEQYWPEQGNENNYGYYTVRCMAEKVFSEFVAREFIVARGKDTREVTQYQYTAWPDKTVPDNVASLLEFRDIVEQKQSVTSGPVMVHCSAGIGRTGTYIALDILIKEGKDDQSVDIFGCVNALRGQRVQLVQNLEQYIYLHHCVLYALSCAPEPRPVSIMTHLTSDERLSAQHKAFVSLQHLTNRDKKMGTKNVTRKENRTGADIPDDKHRVRLGLIEKDYINAVYVNGYQEYNKFILAQTPLQGTLEDFASMLYQEQCSCVVCLDDENVIDKSIVQYLPSVNKVVTFGQFQLICTDIDRKQDFISRKLKVSRIGVSLSEEVSVFHYQFKGWSSIDCVPRSIQSFLNLVTDVEKTYQSPNSKHPIVVHCSTGAERSALFCAVSILMEKVAVEKEVSVLNTVCQVCSRRRSAFQDIEHLRFCYSCVEQMSEVSDSSTYYNSRNM